MSVFDAAMQLKPGEGEGQWTGQTHPGFQNMIGPYGGWSAAILAKAILEQAEDDLELVSLTVEFLSAIPDGAVVIEVECDRAGKGTSFWSARMLSHQTQEVCCKASAVLARRKDTLEWTEPSMPDVAAPENLERVNLPVAWAQTLDLRMARNMPFQGMDTTWSAAWARLDDTAGLDALRLIALSDSPAPRVFMRVTEPQMISTVSLTLYLHACAEDFARASDGWVLAEAEGARGTRGFFDQHARLWSRDGGLLGTSQQTVWYRTPA